MGLKFQSIIDEKIDSFVDKTPEKMIRDRRPLEMLQKVKRLDRTRTYNVLPKLKGLERARRKLERHLSSHDEDCVYDSGVLENGELKLDTWWNSIREEFSDLKTGVEKNKEIC